MLAARFPQATGKPAGGVPTGVRALDEALGGGLPIGRLTELVVEKLGCGGQSVLAQLLRTTRVSRQRVALVDAADSFAPEAFSAAALRHLVWVRCANLEQTLAAADLLVRDANYAVVVLDLCGCAERVLRRTPATLWHRLHRAAQGGGAVLVKTELPLVPAVPWRLVLREPLPLGEQRLRPQAELVGELEVELDRGRHANVVEFEELAG
jgi:hypothetical protein